MAVRLNLRAVCVDVIVRLLIARRELRVRPAIPEIVVFWSTLHKYSTILFFKFRTSKMS